MAKDDAEEDMSLKEDFYFVPTSSIKEPTEKDFEAAKFPAKGGVTFKTEPEQPSLLDSGENAILYKILGMVDHEDPNNGNVGLGVAVQNPNMYVITDNIILNMHQLSNILSSFQDLSRHFFF